MHIHFLDPYQEGTSLVHRLDPRVKFILVILFILTTALTETGEWPVYIFLAALVLSVELLSELSLTYYLKRALLAVPFVLAALPVLFTIEGRQVAALPFGLAITEPGLARFASIAIKSWISIQAAIILSTTTRFPEILLAMRAVRFPRMLVSIIGLMWRYIFVIGDEALRLVRARQSRSGAGQNADFRTGGSIAWRAKTTGGMAGSLFLRSIERSDRIYLAMISRGYDGEVRTLPQPKIPASGWVVLIVVSLILAFLLVFGSFI